MTREFLQQYFDHLCEMAGDPMSSDEREAYRRHRAAVATLLAFWGE